MGEGDRAERRIAPRFDHDPDRWAEFSRRYAAELRDNEDEVEALRATLGGKPATLIYAAHDMQHNNAVVLKDFLAGGE